MKQIHEMGVAELARALGSREVSSVVSAEGSHAAVATTPERASTKSPRRVGEEQLKALFRS